MKTEILAIIIWPACLFISVIIISFIFKKPLTQLISLGIKLKHSNFEATLGLSDDKTNIEKQKQETLSNEPIEGTAQPQLYNNTLIEMVIERMKTQDKEQSNPHKIDTEYLYRKCAILRILLEFEKVYNSIFGSQIFILKMINQTPTGTPVELVKAFFETSVITKNDDFFKNYGFDQYINYLIRSELLIQEDDKFKITPFGREFLMIMQADGRSENRPY